MAISAVCQYVCKRLWLSEWPVADEAPPAAAHDRVWRSPASSARVSPAAALSCPTSDSPS